MPIERRSSATDEIGVGPASQRVEAKEAARRAARRARRAQVKRVHKVDALIVHALVLDDELSPSNLCRLLDAFGFRVQHVGTSEQALTVLEQTRLAVAFLDLSLLESDNADGLDLCRRIKQKQLTMAGEPPAVMLLSDTVSTTARVQVKLAGGNALLAKPVTRGSVASSLEAHDVVLPADPRGG